MVQRGRLGPRCRREDYVGQVTDALGDDVLFEGARCAAEGKVTHGDA